MACLHPYHTPLTLMACVKSQIFSSVLTASSSLVNLQLDASILSIVSCTHAECMIPALLYYIKSAAIIQPEGVQSPSGPTPSLARHHKSSPRPGALTMTSSLPNVSTALSTIDLTSASLLTSHFAPTTWTSANFDWIS